MSSFPPSSSDFSQPSITQEPPNSRFFRSPGCLRFPRVLPASRPPAVPPPPDFLFPRVPPTLSNYLLLKSSDLPTLYHSRVPKLSGLPTSRPPAVPRVLPTSRPRPSRFSRVPDPFRASAISPLSSSPVSRSFDLTNSLTLKPYVPPFPAFYFSIPSNVPAPRTRPSRLSQPLGFLNSPRFQGSSDFPYFKSSNLPTACDFPTFRFAQFSRFPAFRPSRRSVPQSLEPLRRPSTQAPDLPGRFRFPCRLFPNFSEKIAPALDNPLLHIVFLRHPLFARTRPPSGKFVQGRPLPAAACVRKDSTHAVGDLRFCDLKSHIPKQFSRSSAPQRAPTPLSRTVRGERKPPAHGEVRALGAPPQESGAQVPNPFPVRLPRNSPVPPPARIHPMRTGGFMSSRPTPASAASARGKQLPVRPPPTRAGPARSSSQPGFRRSRFP